MAPREKLNPTVRPPLSGRGAACAVAAVNAWLACALLPGLPTRLSPLELGLSALGVLPAVGTALVPPRDAARERAMRLFVGPLALLGSVLVLDLRGGLALDPARACAAAASFVVYLALAAATRAPLPSVTILREQAHADRGSDEAERRARRRSVLAGFLTAQSFALVAVAPFVVAPSESAARWGAAAKEGRVLTLLFGLSLALLVLLGILGPAQRKTPEAERTPLRRFGLGALLACIALAVAYVGGR